MSTVNGDGILEFVISKAILRSGNFEGRENSSRLAVIHDDQIETLIKIMHITRHGISQRYSTYLI